MNIGRKAILVAMVILQAGWLWAATIPGSIRRDFLAESENLDRLSFGLGFEAIQRGIEWEAFSRSDILDAYSGDAMLGWDVHPAVTLFATAGASAVNDSRAEVTADSRFKWSVGFAVNMWRFDLLNPEWMSGTLTLKTVAECSVYESEGMTEGDRLKWTDARVFLPIGFEMFEDLTPLEDPSLKMSLNLYLGPVVSLLDGWEEAGGVRADFEGVRQVGVIAGLDLFLAANLSLGVYTEIFDETSVGGSLRYHF